MIFRENHKKGKKFTVATGNCSLHRTDSSIWNLSFHKFLLLKNSPAKRTNSRTWKPALVFAGKQDSCKAALTARGKSHIVIVVPGVLVMQASYVRLTYVVSDPWTALSRSWILWLQCGRKLRTATPLCLHYPVWKHTNRSCLATELLAPLSKTWLMLWSVLFIH